MGKATILAAEGNGRYEIELERDMARIEAGITSATARISALVDQVDAAELNLATAQALYTSNPSAGNLEALLSAQRTVNRLIIEKMMSEKELERLQSAVKSITGGAWCADATSDLSGTVGTIEIPGERGYTLIQPGYDGNATYNATRDGILQPALAGTPANVYRNWALLPGWQKWRPTYRYGTITAIDDGADTCDLTLIDIKSKHQGLSVNQTPTLSDVPIVYMDCNAEAFDVGDIVAIKFVGQDWDDPQVIGFYTNPRPCSDYVQIKINGTPCQEVKRCRLYHPDYGYSDVDTPVYTSTENPDMLNLADFAGHTPGGVAIESCFIEINRGDWLGYWWECLDVIYMPDEGDDAEVAGADLLRQYDVFLIGSITDLDIELDDLGVDDRKTVIFVNNEYATYSWINGVQVGNAGGGDPSTHAIEFFWNGHNWWHTYGPFQYKISLRQLNHYSSKPTPFSPTFPYMRIYDKYYGHGEEGESEYGPFKIVAPCEWYRSTQKIMDMGISSGQRVLSISGIKTVTSSRLVPVFSNDKLCSDCTPIDVPDDETVSPHIVFTGGSYPYPTGDQGDITMCSDGITTSQISGAYIYAGQDDASVDSVAVVSDRYAQMSPLFGDFTATLTYQTQFWELVIEDPEEHICSGGTLEVSEDLGYYTLALTDLPDGQF